MFEYLIVGFCFLLLISIKFYLFKVSYDKKLKYYTNPMELAKEFIANQSKTYNDEQQKVMLDNYYLLAQRNIQITSQEFKLNNFSEVSERLRNIALMLAIIKLKFKNNQKMIDSRLKQVGTQIYPHFTIFTEIQQFCNKNDGIKKIDKDLLKTISNYIDDITLDLGQYLKAK